MQLDFVAISCLLVIAAVIGTAVASRFWKDPLAGLYLWVLLLPVTKTITSFMGYDAGEGPAVLRKLTLADPVLLFTLVASAFASRPGSTIPDAQSRRIVWLFAGFCGVGFLSALRGEAGLDGLIELSTYIWLLVSLLLLCHLVRSEAVLRQVLATWWWATVVACVGTTIGVLLLASGRTEGFFLVGGRVDGFFEAPNQVQSFMIASTPLLCTTAFRRGAPTGRRLIDGLLIVLAFAGVLGSGSRGGIVWEAVGIWLALMISNRRLAITATVLAVVLAGSAWQVVQQYQDDLPFALRRVFSLFETDSLDLRELSHGRADQLLTWKTVFAENPLIGVGPGSFRYNIPRLVPGGKAQEMHNSYLSILAETGLVGAFLMFGLIGIVLARAAALFRAMLRQNDPERRAIALTLLISFFSLLCYGTVNYGMRQRYFWFVVALLITIPPLYVPRFARSRFVRAAAPRLRANPAPAGSRGMS